MMTIAISTQPQPAQTLNGPMMIPCRSSLLALTILLSMGLVAPGLGRAQVFIGEIDNFQTATTQGWQSGAGASDPTLHNPNPPVAVANAGPQGAGDYALQITGSGTGLAGSKLVAFNDSQWTGNYTGAGVTGIKMDVNNIGVAPLDLRLGLQGGSGLTTAQFVSSTPISISPGSGWQSITFSLAPNLFSGLAVGTDFATTLQAITFLRLMHSSSASPLAWQGTPVNGSLLVDNITAVPEIQQTSLVFALLCAFLALVWRRRSLPVFRLGKA